MNSTLPREEGRRVCRSYWRSARTPPHRNLVGQINSQEAYRIVTDSTTNDNRLLYTGLFQFRSKDFTSYHYVSLLNPNQTGGGVESTPPSTFRAIISRKFFPAHRAFVTFFFRVLRNFWCYFRKNRAYRSEVTQHYVIERQLKIWEFSGFVYKTYGKCSLC